MTSPEESLSPWEASTTWQPVSSKLIPVRLISLTLSLIPVALAIAVAWPYLPTWLGVLLVAGFAGLVALRTVVTIRAVRSWGYAERDEDLVVRHGVMIRRLSIVPYGRMQFVDVSAGPLERAFGLATVDLHTAAAASDASIPGLEPEAATRLRDRLAALGRTHSEGL